MRGKLEHLGLKSLVRTTGGKGLHVVVPLTARVDWETVKAVAKAISTEIVQEAPDRYTAAMSKKERPGEIFIDYFRNTRGATSIASCSTRAHPGAPVATPLE